MYTVTQGEPTTFIIYTTSVHWLFKRLFKSRYQHCYLLIWDGYQWIVLDKNLSYLNVATVEMYQDTILTSHNQLLELLEYDTDVTYIQQVDTEIVREVYADTISNFIVSALRPNTCVEYVKSYLGMNTLCTLTPNSLKEVLD